MAAACPAPAAKSAFLACQRGGNLLVNTASLYGQQNYDEETHTYDYTAGISISGTLTLAEGAAVSGYASSYAAYEYYAFGIKAGSFVVGPSCRLDCYGESDYRDEITGETYCAALVWDGTFAAYGAIISGYDSSWNYTFGVPSANKIVAGKYYSIAASADATEALRRVRLHIPYGLCVPAEGEYAGQLCYVHKGAGDSDVYLPIDGDDDELAGIELRGTTLYLEDFWYRTDYSPALQLPSGYTISVTGSNDIGSGGIGLALAGDVTISGSGYAHLNVSSIVGDNLTVSGVSMYVSPQGYAEMDNMAYSNVGGIDLTGTLALQRGASVDCYVSGDLAGFNFGVRADDIIISPECTLNVSVQNWSEGELDVTNVGVLWSGTLTPSAATITGCDLDWDYGPAEASASKVIGDYYSVVSSSTQTVLPIVEITVSAVEAEDETMKFTAANLTLESDIAINFYVSEETIADLEHPYVVFEKGIYDPLGNLIGTEETTVTTSKTKDGCKIFTFDGINATEMGSTVYATLYGAKDGVLSKGPYVEYSVKSYAMRMLGKTDDAELKTLLVDMLLYGAKAQAYFFPDHNAEFCDADLTADQRALATATDPTLADKMALRPLDGETVSFESASLILSERVEMNFYINPLEGAPAASDMELHVAYDDILGHRIETVVKNIEGNCFTFDGLDARDMRALVTVQIFDKNTGNPISGELDYSIETYAARKTNTTAEDYDADLAELVNLMIKYGDSAKRFFLQ